MDSVPAPDTAEKKKIGCEERHWFVGSVWSDAAYVYGASLQQKEFTTSRTTGIPVVV